MSRTSLMTWGLLLILVGVQFNLVESFVLTPRATEVWNNRWNGYPNETVPGDYQITSNGYFQSSNGNNFSNPNYRSPQTTSSTPYAMPNYQRFQNSSVPAYRASFGNPIAGNRYGGPQKMLTLPNWFCWPPIFLGSVLFLYGVASKE